MNGLAVSFGLSIGKILIYEKHSIPEFEKNCRDEKRCLDAFKEALEKSKNDLETLKEKSKNTLDEEHLAIFDAHIQMVDDVEIFSQVTKLIQEGKSAAFAYETVTSQFIAMFESMEDAYFKERASDIKDIQYRVLAHLTDTPIKDLGLLDEDVIVFAYDLTPSDTASLDLRHVKGFATVIGGRTSHTAIMARSLGIPAIVGVGDVLMKAPDKATVILNANTGKITVDPDQKTLLDFKQTLKDFKKYQETLSTFKTQKTLLKSGESLPLYANIGSPKDLDLVLENGAEGIGLFRSEFLFMDSQESPSLETQINAYQTVFKAIGPVIVRTLDIGGDKKLPYIKMDEEENPFLGVRAIRLCFQEIDLFKTQLKALLIASKNQKDVRIMFPMIARMDELLKAKAILNEVKDSLNLENIVYQKDIKVGIMIEIPSAALNARNLAKECDFFSIGTNDLIQYTYAADRMNPHVSYLYDPLDPTLLRLIHQVIQDAHFEDTEIGVCGEMASDPRAAMLLAGMGIDELSMSASALLTVRETLSRYTKSDLEKLLQSALEKNDSNEVNALFQ
jgi:phosphotransferase system enzyme I (PtsI)